VASLWISYWFSRLSIVYEIPDLYAIVLKSLKSIPQGKVTTYGEIGKALGDKISARAVGYIMATNRWPDIYPCYKVVGSDGNIGGYSLGTDLKKRKLRKEGIRIVGGHIENLKEIIVMSKDLKIPPVLESLQRLQQYLGGKVDLSNFYGEPRYVVSLDLGYINGPPDISIATACLFDLEENKVLSLAISVVPIFMPYIPTYLAFRELPAALLALEKILDVRYPDIIAVDGQGILHPRKFGIASHIGVITNIPSIGIAKSILVGKVIGDWKKYGELKYAPIDLRGEICGYVVSKGKHKIIVSPGHRTSVDGALKIALSLEWRNNENEPYVMRIPHIVSTHFRKYLKNLWRLLRDKQTDLTSFIS